MPVSLKPAMAKRVEVWPTEKLVPYDRNPRTHSEEQVRRIAASIAEFGFLNPVLVDTDAGIIAGHGRLMAAKELGLDEVPVVVLDHLTPAQRKAYVIADNQLALNAGWDNELLKAELADLEGLEFDLTLLGWGENLPSFGPDVDYSVLDDDDDVDGQLDEMASDVKKAIQIEFEQEHYEEAQELIKFWRAQGGYVGLMLIEKLAAEKAKL
jgi:hypothetical protein